MVEKGHITGVVMVVVEEYTKGLVTYTIEVSDQGVVRKHSDARHDVYDTKA